MWASIMTDISSRTVNISFTNSRAHGIVSSTVVTGLTSPLQSVSGIGSDVALGSICESSKFLCFVPPGLTALPTLVKGGSRN